MTHEQLIETMNKNALRLDTFVVSHVTAGERDAFRMFMQNASAFEPWEIPLGNMVVRSKGLDCPDGCLGITIYSDSGATLLEV